VSTDELAASIRDVTFGTIRLHEAYDIGEVDYLLDRLLAAVERGGDLIEILDHAALSEVRLREGYDIAEVNAFLAQVRERATAVEEPEPPPPGPDPGFLEVQAPPPDPARPAPQPTVIIESRGFWARLFRRTR